MKKVKVDEINMLLIKAVLTLTDINCQSVLFGRCLMFGTTSKTIKVNSEIWKQVKKKNQAAAHYKESNFSSLSLSAIVRG